MSKLIKRKDGTYSRRGLWDNIRENAGSGKKPTQQMLEQEKKIKAKFQVGGNLPLGQKGLRTKPKVDTLYVSDPNHYRLKAYQDSSRLYNQSKKEWELGAQQDYEARLKTYNNLVSFYRQAGASEEQIKNLVNKPFEKQTYSKHHSHPINATKDIVYNPKTKTVRFNQYDTEIPFKDLDPSFQRVVTEPIKPTRAYGNEFYDFFYYDKPKQRVEYRPEPEYIPRPTIIQPEYQRSPINLYDINQTIPQGKISGLSIVKPQITEQQKAEEDTPRETNIKHKPSINRQSKPQKYRLSPVYAEQGGIRSFFMPKFRTKFSK